MQRKYIIFYYLSEVNLFSSQSLTLLPSRCFDVCVLQPMALSNFADILSVILSYPPLTFIIIIIANFV